MKHNIISGILGFVVGDALGVPVEFMSRESLAKNPVTDMRAYGTHNQPKGTWSDDSTMTFCLMESLLAGVDYHKLSDKHIAWINDGYMTAHNELFDIGGTTMTALRKYEQGVAPLDCGQTSGYDNGNGSLMRILPVAFYAMGMSMAERMELSHNLSKLTHGHARSQMACGIYVQMAVELCKGYSKEKAYDNMVDICNQFYDEYPERKNFHRILDGDISSLCEPDIKSTGYVVDTLEAAIWCLLTTDSYVDCVLKAVNLGDDTDTVGAIVGGLAGILYGYDGIPSEWKSSIVKVDEIENLIREFAKVCKPFAPLYGYLPYFEMKHESKWDNGCPAYDKELYSFEELPHKLGYMDYQYHDTLEKYGVETHQLHQYIPTANTELVLAILTYYIRQEQFCVGSYFSEMENGTFLAILKRMRELEQE